MQYTIHWDKTQILKKFSSDKINLTKNALFFISWTPTHDSFTFNSQFLEGIYSWNFIPGWNSSCDEIILVYGKMPLTVYTFCRDEISARDELIPVKKTVAKFHPEMKKRKNDV